MRTPKIPIRRIILLVAIFAVTTAPRAAAAHAFPASERPGAGSTLKTPPPEVAIRFDNPIEKMFARVQVVDAAGADAMAGPPVLSIDRLELTAPLKALAPGTYTVKWSVVAEDSHRSEGSFTFTVAGSGD